MKQNCLRTLLPPLTTALLLAVQLGTNVGALAGPSPTTPEIFIADSKDGPTPIIQILTDGSASPRSVTYSSSTSEPVSAIAAIALFGQSEAYFVPANSWLIMMTDVRETRLVYEHDALIRDIAFDSHGILFFSEASGAGGDKRIYRLGFMGEGEAGPPLKIIKLNEVGGFWAGNFTFEQSDRLFVSTGNRVPSAIYESTATGFERRYSLNEPITGFTFQTARRLLFTSHSQVVYALEGFSVRSTVHTSSRANWLNDVAVVTSYKGGLCSVSGRLLGGTDLWNQTYVNAYGPNLFWRYVETDGRPASSGAFAFESIPAGTYWLVTDIHGDVGHVFEPQPLPVVCPTEARRTDLNFRYR